MKKIFLISLLFLSACHSRQQAGPVPKLDWLDKWDVAAAASAEKGRPMIVAFSTEWCPYCKFMEERIFNQRSVDTELRNFVRLKINCDKAENQQLMDKFGVRGFPTFVIFGPDGKELLRFNDVGSAVEMENLLLEASYKQPGHDEIREADRLAGEDNNAAAHAVYEKAFHIIQAAKPDDLALEDALRGMLNTGKGDKEATIKLAEELVQKYSDSPYLPDYFKILADCYSSKAIKQNLLKEAAKYIEWRLAAIENNTETYDKVIQITLDQHVDLLADIYKELGYYDKIAKMHLHAAKAAESYIDRSGGVANNLHMAGTTARYYMGAGRSKKAAEFMKNAIKAMPDYWPFYLNYAKALAAEGELDQAIEHAKKGYELAEEVARPRVALAWGELLAASGDYKGAAAVLEMARDELKKTGATNQGRAKKMSSQLDDRIREYQSELSAGRIYE